VNKDYQSEERQQQNELWGRWLFLLLYCTNLFETASCFLCTNECEGLLV